LQKIIVKSLHKFAFLIQMIFYLNLMTGCCKDAEFFLLYRPCLIWVMWDLDLNTTNFW